MNPKNSGKTCYGCCLAADQRTERGSRLPARLAEATGWTASVVGLVLMPKCPACIAAYLALGTGLTFSIPAATQIRAVLVTIFAASIIFLGARRMRLRIGAASRRLVRGGGVLF